jgi:membrane-bound acyltransferase YfiQ involved in biofilm formation
VPYADYLDAGVLSLPAGFGTLFGGVILSAFLHRIKHTHWQLRAGIIVQVAFTAALAALTPASKTTGLALQFFSNLPFICAQPDSQREPLS